MILVHKKCNGCSKVDEELFVPADMVGTSYVCPYCQVGVVTHHSKELQQLQMAINAYDNFVDEIEEYVRKSGKNFFDEDLEILKRKLNELNMS